MSLLELTVTVLKSQGATSSYDDTNREAAESSSYRWTNKDVMEMPLDAFERWWYGPAISAVRAGNKTCRTPADQGRYELVEAAIARAKLEGIHVPPPTPLPTKEPQFVCIDNKRLRRAMRRKAQGMSPVAIARKTGLDVYTVKLLMRAERRTVWPRTLGAVCKWIGLDPEEFKV